MRVLSLGSLLFFLVIALSNYPCRAESSCCKHKLGGQQPVVSEFIDDPADKAPDKFQGQPRYLVDPSDFRPDDWDSEDDGEWEPNLIPNPDYNWKPRQIPNPNYVPPPTYWDKLLAEIRMSLPWLVLGVIVTGVTSMSISLPPFKNALDWWKRSNQNANGKSIIGSTSLAAMLGLATPLCSCGALPVAAGFWNEGVPLGSVVSFLVASQSAGIDSAAITYGLLGPLAVFSRLAGAMILAIVAGECLPKVAASQSKQVSGSKCSDSNGKQTQSSSLKGFVEFLADTAYEVFPSVLVGLALSTYVVHFHPTFFHPGTLATRGATTGVFMRWVLLATAVPLQLCEHTTVTLAAAIQKSGGSPGLAFGFLLSAPAVNLPTQALLTQKVMGIQGKGGSSNIGIRIAVAVSVTALILSYIVDMLNLDLLVQEEADSDVGNLSFPEMYRALCPWFAGLLFVIGFVRAHLGGLYSTIPGSASSIDTNGKDSCCNPSNKTRIKND